MTAAIGEELGIVTTITMMLINFVTEFFWDKFVVFNDKVITKLEKLFKRNKGEEVSENNLAEDAVEEVAISNEETFENE